MNVKLARLGALIVATVLAFSTPFLIYAHVISQAVRGEIAPSQAAFFLTVNLVENIAVFIPPGFLFYPSFPSCR